MQCDGKAVRATVIAIWLLAPVWSWALSEGRGAGGEPYVTGGVSSDERDVLRTRRQEFNVWITTAVRQSGAYLSDVRIDISDSANRQVVSATLDGPLLLVRLAAGQYTVEAFADQQKQRHAVTVGAQGHRELYLYFDVAAETLPKDAEAEKEDPRRTR